MFSFYLSVLCCKSYVFAMIKVIFFFKGVQLFWTVWIRSMERNWRITPSFLKASRSRIWAAYTLERKRDGIRTSNPIRATRIRGLSLPSPTKCLHSLENFPASRENNFFPRRIRVFSHCSIYLTAKEYCRAEISLITKQLVLKASRLISVFCAYSSHKLFTK